VANSDLNQSSTLGVYDAPPSRPLARGENPGHQPVDLTSVSQQCYTTNLDLDVTEGCNLGCVYCFKNELKGPTMTLETAQRALEWLLEASGPQRSVNVNFMGGEPTLKWSLIRDFVIWARRRGASVAKDVSFSMTSNLTLWTDEIRAFVDEYGFGVLMSIDGCPEVQNGQRPAKNGKPTSATVAHWARSMLSTRPRSQARSTVTPKYVHLLFESMKYLHELGFAEVAIASASYSEWTPGHMRTLRSELTRVVSYIEDEYRHHRDFNLSVWKYYIKRLVHPRRTSQAVRIDHQPCGAGKGYLMVDHVGDIWPCHRFDGADQDAGTNGKLRLGNIFKPGFNHELQRTFLDFDHLKDNKERCQHCPVLEICGGFCPAANLSSTGSLYTPHDAFCDWSALLYEAATDLYDRLAGSGLAFDRMLESSLGAGSDGQR
jgi:uncharacterized protein